MFAMPTIATLSHGEQALPPDEPPQIADWLIEENTAIRERIRQSVERIHARYKPRTPFDSETNA